MTEHRTKPAKQFVVGRSLTFTYHPTWWHRLLVWLRLRKPKTATMVGTVTGYSAGSVIIIDPDA